MFLNNNLFMLSLMTLFQISESSKDPTQDPVMDEPSTDCGSNNNNEPVIPNQNVIVVVCDVINDTFSRFVNLQKTKVRTR